MRRISLIGIGLLGIIGFSCNTNSFKGSEKRAGSAPSPTPAVPVQTTQVSNGVTGANLSLSCAQSEDSQVSPIEVVRRPGQALQIQLHGDICPQSTHNLSILFIIDWSGSMAENDPGSGSSCGRFDAMQAIVQAVRQQRQQGDNVKAGFIGFNERVASQENFQDFEAFAGSLDGSKICSHQGSTSYVAAFEGAEAMLRNVTGRKVIYFISDGYPTVGRTTLNEWLSSDSDADDPAKDGIAAGQHLRDSITDVTMNGLLLGTDGAAARQVLADAMGAADRVRLVNDANQLATEIMKFPSSDLVDGTGRCTLNKNSQSAGVALQSFGRNSSLAGVWTYTGQPVIALSATEPDGEISFAVSANDQDGKVLTSTIRLRIVTR